MRKLILAFIVMFVSVYAYAQMTINGETFYGNEWIDYDKDYIKLTLEETGIYRLTYDDLLNNGFPAQIEGSTLQLFNNGEQVAIMVSNDGAWTSDDFLLFYGQRNDGENDRFHYRTWEKDQLNLKYNLYSNARAYYLTWDENSIDNPRFIEKENNVGPNIIPAKQEFYMHREEQVYGENHWAPPSSSPDIQYSSFIRAEGFGDGMKPSHTLEYDVTHVYDAPIKPRVELRLGTNTSTGHLIEFRINDNFLNADTFENLKVQDYAYSFNNNILKSKTRLTVVGKKVTNNFIIGHSALIYPRAFNADGSDTFVFEREGNSSDDYYEIEDFKVGSINYAFDVKNNTFYKPAVVGTTLKLHIPDGGENRSDLFIIAQRQIKSPLTMTPRSFVSMDDMDPEYLILTSEKLNNSDEGDNPITAYADFRRTEKGGGYKVGVVNVEDIYDQFGYGVENCSYSIRNFSNYMKVTWPNFQMAFIIGKAIDYSRRYKTSGVEIVVPTYGHPGSDNLLFSEGRITYPFVGIGRLAARSQDDVRNYLRKIKAHADLGDVTNKTVEERMWLKDMIHLSGGDESLQASIFNHLEEMRAVMEGGDFGGSVKTFKKISSDPVQTEISQEISAVIDNGISMLTFFGHSNEGTFDFSVEDPTEYNNAGRLPVILSMGCYSGNIHETRNELSLSEKMVLTEDVGAIAFIASSGAAFLSPLSRLGKDLYSKLADDFYGKPLGLVNQQMAIDLYDSIYVSVQTLQEQHTLHGDPAIQLFTAEGPDYVVDFATINTNGQVGATDEKITVNFDIVNLGRGITDTLNNMIIHSYANQVDTIYFKAFGPKNRQAVTLEIANPGFDAIGKNNFEIVIDIDNKVAELPLPIAEDNNYLSKAYNNEGYNFFVFDNSAFPIYPKEFSIVNKKDITLKASATNAFAKEEYYLLEIDTTENFDSPLLEQTEVLSSPGLIEWDPSIEFQNEVVYYWRISPKEMSNTVWNVSSFVYLENASDGWNQSHAYQWLKDDYVTMSYEEPDRKFLYSTNVSEVKIKNGFHPANKLSATILNTPYDYDLLAGEIASGVYISVFDKETGLPWLNQPSPTGGLYESDLITSWALDWGVFPFATHNPEKRYRVIKFLEDVVPEGSYVSIFTIQRSDVGNPVNGIPQVNEWESDAAVNPDGRDLLSTFEMYGAERIRELIDESLPYIFVFRKGDDSFEPVEIIASDASSSIEYNFSITGRWFEGSVNSTEIGPAQEWNRLQWSLEDVNLENDEYQLDLIGIKENGDEEVIFPNVDAFDFDISFVDANVYPHLKLNLYSKDDESRSPVQINYWRVLYTEKPEAVLDVNKRFVFESDTLFLGDKLKLGTVASNISNTDMDSLLVKYTIVDQANSEVNFYDKLAPLKAQESANIDFEFITDKLLGLHQFRVEINPEMAQPEQYAFNNIGIKDFVVQGDRINPILDVTFDGMRIMDGDIISPRPHIKIDLKDENEFLLIKDISHFDLALQRLPDNQSYPINLNSPDISFTPADSLNGNHAYLDFYPELETGEYILYIQAEDVSGNLSGDQDLEVRFRVVEESQVSNVLNYPNPFSTSTQFVFTLTGYEVPEVFTIQIMTVTGKVVKEITKDELGDLRIGVNRTDYKWNGTDEYGSRLANGVYLYRVFTSQGDEAFNHFNNDSIDGFFKKGFGKLVIMR